MRWTLWAAAIPLLIVVEACLPPPPTFYYGPSFGAPPDVSFPSTPDVITTTDPNILAAVLQVYETPTATNAGFTVIDVAINLSELSVTRAAGEQFTGVNIIPAPTETPDNVEGYQLSLEGTTVTYTDLETSTMFEIELGLPLFYELLPVDRFGGSLAVAFPNFVSESTEKLFLMYEASLNCTDPAVTSVECVGCGDEDDCEILASFVTIVDLQSGDYRTRETSFLRHTFLFPGAVVADVHFRPSWDEVQIVDSNVREPLCQSRVLGYFFYTDEGLEQIADGFSRRSFNALIPGTGSPNPRDLEGYRVTSTLVREPFTDSPLPTAYATSFTIERYSVLTGGVLESFPLDVNQVWELAGLELPSPMTDNPTTAMPTLSPPTSPVPTPLPMPVTTAPFPTIPIASPQGTPISTVAPVSVPTAPVAITSPPFPPTIPIAFPLGPTNAPIPAPRPTIPIAFPLGPTDAPIRAPLPTIPISFPLGPTTSAPFPTIPVAFPPEPVTAAPVPTILIPFGPTTRPPVPTIPIAFP